MGNVNWMRARESELRSELFGEDLREDPAGRRPRQLRLGDVRQRARAADARRPLAAARGDDDDPGGLPRPRRPARPPEGLLRLPLLPDGAVGRARRRWRSPTGAWSARRSTATGCARAAGWRRPTGTSCSARSPACSTSRPRRSGASAACSRASCSSSTSSGAGSSRTRRSSARSPRPTPYGEWFARNAVPLRRAAALQRSHALRPAAAPAPARLRLHPGGPAGAARADGDRRGRADRLDGQRPLAGGALRPGAAAVLLLQAALRAGHQPADRPDPRGDRDEPGDERWATSATCSTRRPSTRTSSSWTSRSCSTASSRRCATSTTTSTQPARSTSPGSSQKGPAGMAEAIERICRQAHEAIAEGVNIIILSDRLLGPRRAPIPSLLAVAAVHHHLVLEGTRLRAGIIVESGEPREVHHFATLIGYGASAINPYLLLETLDELVARRAASCAPATDGSEVRDRRRAGGPERRQGDRQRPAEDDLQDGHLDDPVLPRRADLRGRRPRAGADRHATSPGTASRIGGVGLEVLAHGGARAPRPRLPGSAATSCCRSAASTRGAATASTTCGTRRRSRSSSTPCGRPTATSAARCRATARRTPTVRESPAFEKYREYAQAVNEDAARRATLRGLLEIGGGERRGDADPARGGRAGEARSSSASAPGR